MSFNINNNNHTDIQYLATYGTLRDDNNSDAPWAVDLIKDINTAISGNVAGYQLFQHSTLKYPFAIFTGNSDHSIVVRLLSWPSKEQFEQKIHEADIIEGDQYERKIVEVAAENQTILAYIYVSKTNTLDSDWRVIPSGDWLQRDT